MQTLAVVAVLVALGSGTTTPEPTPTTPVTPSSCHEGDIIKDPPSTSYWKCHNGTYDWVRTGNDPDSGSGEGNRPGKPEGW